MSDTTFALLITVLGLLALAAWVPLLHAIQTFTQRSPRQVVQEDVPSNWQDEQGLDNQREVA